MIDQNTIFQASFTGFMMKPSTVIAGYIHKKNRLIIRGVLPNYLIVRKNDGEKDKKKAFYITNDDSSKDWDLFLANDKLSEMVDSFLLAKAKGIISFDSSAEMANPSLAVEMQGWEKSKPKVMVGAELSNANVAVMSICHAIDKTRQAAKAVNMMQSMSSKLMGGEMVSIY